MELCDMKEPSQFRKEAITYIWKIKLGGET